MPTPILFVDHAERLGGAEYSLLMLTKQLDRSLWQPYLVCPEGELADAAKKQNMPCHILPLPRLRRSVNFVSEWRQTSKTLGNFANEIGAKGIVANTVRAAFYASMAAKLSKRPFIWHMRDFWLSESQPRYQTVDKMLKKVLCASAAQVVANSKATASQLPCTNVAVIHNGIAFSDFLGEADGGTFRQQHSIPSDAPLVGIVGRLRPWKGQHRFIEMATAVSQTHPTVHFVIVGGVVFNGGNGYANLLADLVQQKPLSEKVHFTGHLKNVKPALAAMDIFVHSGDPEPFGLVNIEAMAAGKPIVAFAHGALPEIVQDGETGLLVPPGNLSAMADAVKELLNAPEKAAKFGAAGRERGETFFSIEQTAVNFSSMLQKSV